MDVRFINPFLEGTLDVLTTMAFISPRAGKPYLKKDHVSRGDVSGIIGIAGDVKGSLALSFSEGCIFKIVSNMLGEEHTAIDDGIRDAVGELTNMISGAARKKIEGLGFKLFAAIPTIVSGKDHTIMHVLPGPCLVIPFETDHGPFVVDVCISDPR